MSSGLSSPPLAPTPVGSPPIRRWKRWLFAYGPVLLMMAVIFAASADAGSSTHSGRLLRLLLGWLGFARELTPAQLELANHYVRKAGHVTEYAVLAALLHRALASARASTAAWRQRWSPRLVLAAVTVVAFYAASDEFHQVFVPTRTPSIWDVLLDTVGGSAGLMLKWAWERWRAPSSR